MARATTVALVCPCRVEFQLCQEILDLGRGRSVSGREVVSRSEADVKVIAVDAGPGKTLAASAAQLLLERYDPDLVLDVGSAGSLSDAVRIGDIVAGAWACEYDICSPMDLPTCAEDLTARTILGDTDGSASRVLERYALGPGAGGPRILAGGIASGERTISDSETRRWLRESLGALACSWESSAVLRTVQLCGGASLALRAITDNADESCSADFEQHWQRSMESLFKLIDRLTFKGWLTRMLERDDS